MASRPPPRFVVRQHGDTSHRRRWWWLGLAWLVSLLLVGLLVGLWQRHAPAPVAAGNSHDGNPSASTLPAQVEALKQQVANLQRAAQVNDVATQALRGTLAQREKELSGLRSDLGFYSRLVSDDGQPQGLKLQEVKLKPIADSQGWNLTLSLTQNAKHEDEVSGTVRVSVEGLRGDQVQRIDWPALGHASQKNGLPFRFTYFQKLQGTIMLPAGFRPTRLRIQVQPAKGKSLNRAVAWDAALSGNITTAQGDHDAQP